MSTAIERLLKWAIKKHVLDCIQRVLNASNLLCLSYRELTELPLELNVLGNLQFLELAGNKLTELPPELGQLKKLYWLDVGNNNLTELLSTIGELTDLKVTAVNNF